MVLVGFGHWGLSCLQGEPSSDGCFGPEAKSCGKEEGDAHEYDQCRHHSGGGVDHKQEYDAADEQDACGDSDAAAGRHEEFDKKQDHRQGETDHCPDDIGIAHIVIIIPVVLCVLVFRGHVCVQLVPCSA